MSPPRRGRPSKVTPVEPGAASSTYEALYPADRSTVQCILCQEQVPDIAGHLPLMHPTVRLEEYRLQYPAAPIVGEIKETPDRVVSISRAEAEAHPGGREAALVEKTLDTRERRAYRADVENLIEQGHKPSYQVASAAYLMTLARRLRLGIEITRGRTGGEIFAGQALDTLHDVEAKISRAIQDLEKIRAQRVLEAGEDPLAVLESELDQAEDFVRAHIGEFQERCPRCGEILTVPALPHWAFEPFVTKENEKVWPVWSRELWKLVAARELPLWVMCYALRTSPEGIQYTAKRRGEPWPEGISMDEEERMLRQRLLADDVTPRILQASPQEEAEA